MFIVFDGVDGAGKSTQLGKAADYLHSQGRNVVTCSDPGSTRLGQQLREMLLGYHEVPVSSRAETLMFMAARAQLVNEIVVPSVERGDVVLCDRFTFSTVVYQGHAGELEPEEIWAVNHVATGGVWPDLTLVFDLPLESALERIGSRSLDRMESRGRDYLESVRKGFVLESKRWPIGTDLIDASPDAETVFEEVRRSLDNAMARKSE